MQVTIDGELYDITATMVVDRMRGRVPEQIQRHWVEVDGVRFPVKQALEAVLDVSRARFTSQLARSVFARLSLATSGPSTTSGPTAQALPSAVPHAPTQNTIEVQADLQGRIHP